MQEPTPLFIPRSATARRRKPSLIDVTLDPRQRAAIEMPAERALLVLGEAGHGKTTVVLHRTARIWREQGRSCRAAVIVWTEGLARLVQPLLVRLGADVEVLTFDRFAREQGRRAFRRLPRESDTTPPNVMRIKRSPALRLALEELAAREPGVIDDDREAPTRRSRAHATRGDLQHLFGDRRLMERVAQAASLSSSVVESVLDRTRVQFGETTERQWSHVIDRQRLVAVDHRVLDEGTATDHVSTVDVEDYAVLFELDRLRAARRGVRPTAPRAFDLLAIDEAQELAPIELALVGRSLAPRATLIVSGDADQQTDDTSTFGGWDAAMRELGAAEHATTTLDIGYRCSPDIVRLARAVRDATGRPAHRNDVFVDDRALATELGRAMASVLRRDRRASIAVICRHPQTARRLAPMLGATVPTRLVFDGRFSSRGLAQVSIVEDVKGLEFDYVVVPDASARDWPDDAATRRAMYVAITRARHQVVFACTGVPTPLIG